nr:MAG TPA: hypothetical protein [Crassvirales sp.]
MIIHQKEHTHIRTLIYLFHILTKKLLKKLWKILVCY